jgi:hypothetical protein
VLLVLLAAALITVGAYPAGAARLHPERWYQGRWCKDNGGEAEVVMEDRTRCDCLTTKYAVEFDFGRKWAEAIGQSLYYSFMTGKKAAVVLILEKKKDRRYWKRLLSTIRHYGLPITAWAVGAGCPEGPPPVFVPEEPEMSDGPEPLVK